MEGGRMGRGRTTEAKDILKVALGYVKSVDYKVSLRWVFYRLLQEGIYSKKEDYNKCKKLFASARKNFEAGWHPETLADETRKILWRGVGSLNKKEWVETLECDLDKFQNQNQIILILFEAKAMLGQFKHYTRHIPLIAFGGDASIPYKWEIAKSIDWLVMKYGKPIEVLYFGDADKKGMQICNSAFRDIHDWAEGLFNIHHCGLTTEQAEEFNLPSNPDKPGEYQWEALSQEQAKKINMTYIEKIQNQDKIEEIQNEEERILKDIKRRLKMKGVSN